AFKPSAARRIFSTDISAYIWRSSVVTESLSPRILIWWADSSPDAYRTTDVSARCDATSNMRVDLPTPGSPPSRTSAPATTPPPSTRSNSLIPVEILGDSTPVISGKRIGDEFQEAGLAMVDVIRSSTKVFHCWQAGHRPIHFGDGTPHS